MVVSLKINWFVSGNAYSLLDAIKSLKGQVDTEQMNVNAISNDLRNKTRRLEEENRQHVEALRRQQDVMSSTENNILSMKAQLENK